MRAHRLLIATLVAAAALAASTAGLAGGTTAPGSLPMNATAAGSTQRANGELQLRALFELQYQFGEFCPAGTPEGVQCVRFVGEGVVPGLGRATVTYVKTVRFESDCPVTQFRTAVIAVAGKGQIDLSMPQVVCGPLAPAGVGPLDLIITEGSGRYAGASGSVQFTSSVFRADGTCGPCGKARDSWTGTLNVPGLDFDTTGPAITGAVAKIVRARGGVKRIRVRYAVAARDAVDGDVPVTCTPRSGRLFRLGRTPVTCSATDSSGNTSQRKFTVKVKRPRR